MVGPRLGELSPLAQAEPGMMKVRASMEASFCPIFQVLRENLKIPETWISVLV